MQKKVKKQQTFLKNRFFLFGVGAALCAELLLYGIAFFPLVQIHAVQVEGNKEVSKNVIEGFIFERLWRTFLLAPTASIFLADTQSMQSALVRAIPELETVHIQRKFPDILTIAVQERGVAALWCWPAQEGQESYCAALDKQGMAFKKADPLLGGIKIYGQGQALNLREVAVKPDVLEAIAYFAREAKRRSLFLQEELSFEIVSENQINVHTGEEWSVYFTHTQDFSWQVTKLQSVLEGKIPPEKRKKLEYIDVRFGNQAYFKYR
ncbi:MAG: hypothetical protein A3C82_00470 [Candidatus Wildermuthbacteria bacterium RIFCSPHIGHO2_02_FULL_47_12]|uniref:POTRA domain-containing protein n=1 Tax=Candidatus Wildermuthbacteria bacterium RIFCSPHIGHO2_02_FULL_47_12 TaxID=1802451 RepID=A0A1G2R4T9_9BACT|nr:MAG: hypothetical protein A3C82_00470 [Candidatus Wildermuthbacteria bacterium RIFCSPHIGHO2_02_FULL_47_12]